MLEALIALEPQFLQYKACSTADSSPSIGSIGRVLEIGREVVGQQTVPLVFAQPDFGRYTLHGVHFAAEGGIVYRLDRQPTMSTHPSTPMTEPDLAVHFAHQTDLPIGSIPFTAYGDDLADQLRRSDAAAVVLDAAIDEHLESIGHAIAHLDAPVFAIGSGGLSLAIAAADGAATTALADSRRRIGTRARPLGQPVSADPTADGCRGRRRLVHPAARARGVARGRAAGLGAVGSAGRAKRRADIGRRGPVRRRTDRRSRPSPKPPARWLRGRQRPAPLGV